MNQDNRDNFSLIDFLRLLYSWRTYLIGVTVAAAVISSVIALMLPEYFRSTATFIPYNSKRIDVATLFLDNPDFDIFGSKRDLDRILSIANSGTVAEYIVHKYGLYKHYDIDSTQVRYHRTEVLTEFGDNLKVVKTEKDAVEISFMDTDKKLAADIVNEIVRKIDEINRQTITNTNTQTLAVLGRSITSREAEMMKLKDSLQRLNSRYNLHYPEKESEILSQSLTETREMLTESEGRLQIMSKYYKPEDSLIVLLKAKIEGLTQRYKSLTQRTSEPMLNLQDLSAGADKVEAMLDQTRKMVREITELKIKYQRAQTAADGSIPSLYMIESAVPAEKKVKPIRWLIVLGSTFGALTLAILFRLLLNYYKSAAAEVRN
jgi:uncharacterized protein involved in exopolysaccharide biosynthesis